MDHVLVELDPELEDSYLGHGGSSSHAVSVPVPIEAKLRNLGVDVLYEVCRVQKLPMADLRKTCLLFDIRRLNVSLGIYDNHFLDHLFELVEQTRDMPDESFNYGVIKLIVALNEQFMVATIGGQERTSLDDTDSRNRVLRVLMRRLGSSKTFGENMIFMLNRAGRTPEDLCMQLLVLKILYLLFTTHGTSEYFYTNDLCVLVDVFLRELIDIDEESESVGSLKHCTSISSPLMYHIASAYLPSSFTSSPHPDTTEGCSVQTPADRPRIGVVYWACQNQGRQPDDQASGRTMSEWRMVCSISDQGTDIGSTHTQPLSNE